VPPGGTVERGETPRAAAARELVEETGVAGDLLPIPAAAAVRSFRADWAPTLSLSYGAVIDRDLPLGGEMRPAIEVESPGRGLGQRVFPRIASASARMCVGSRQGSSRGTLKAYCDRRSEDVLDPVQDVVGHRHQPEFVQDRTHTGSKPGTAANCSSLSCPSA
jgi:ADP-ribose pyrophosphatase YjhB (NUDIX family)